MGNGVTCLQGTDVFPEPVHRAQFYYLDSFMLVSSGPELQLLRHQLDPRRDELKRWAARGPRLCMGGSVSATGDVGSSVYTDAVFIQMGGLVTAARRAASCFHARPELHARPRDSAHFALEPELPLLVPVHWRPSCPRVTVSPTSMPGSACPGPDPTPHSPAHRRRAHGLVLPH